MDDSTIRARKAVEIEAKGNISAMGALIEAGKEVELESRASIYLQGAHVTGKREIDIEAVDSIFADSAILLACEGKVEVEARRGDVDLSGATVRGYRKIEIEAEKGNVLVPGASIAIVTGSTKGDIKIAAKRGTIFDDGVTILAPGRRELKGTVDAGLPSPPETIAAGTLPCP